MDRRLSPPRLLDSKLGTGPGAFIDDDLGSWAVPPVDYWWLTPSTTKHEASTSTITSSPCRGTIVAVMKLSMAARATGVEWPGAKCPTDATSHHVSHRLCHSRATGPKFGPKTPGQSVLTASFATRGPRVQIPSAPQLRLVIVNETKGPRSGRRRCFSAFAAILVPQVHHRKGGPFRAPRTMRAALNVGSLRRARGVAMPASSRVLDP